MDIKIKFDQRALERELDKAAAGAVNEVARDYERMFARLGRSYKGSQWPRSSQSSSGSRPGWADH